MALQHLRSSTANKRPLPAGMSDGQLAINTNLASPGVFFKDSNGDLVKVGPVHVGTTAPNASPAAGGQTGNTKGEQWLDTTGGTYVFKVWDGSAWRSETGTFVDVNGDTMTGALGIIAGSASTPGLFFSGDTNTGVYSPGADQLALGTSGNGRLFIDSSGNVGIGTSSPAKKLHIEDTSGPAQIRITGPTGSSDIYADSNIYFQPNGSTAVTFKSDGKVGVGTTSPGGKLDVKGDVLSNNIIYLTNGNTGNYANVIQSRDASGTLNANISFSSFDNSVAFVQGTSSERARIDSSGRLLVGTSTMTAHVRAAFRGNSFGSGVNSTVYMMRDSANPTTGQTLGVFAFSDSNEGIGAEIAAQSDGTWGTNDYPGRLVFSTTADGSASPTERMRIDSSGRVGVGTALPGARLEVNIDSEAPSGGGTRSGSVFFNASGNSELAVGIDVSLGNRPIWLQGRYPSGAFDSLRYDISLQPLGGNVGIGTTSPAKLFEVKGSASGHFEAAKFSNGQDDGSSDSVSINFGLARTGGFNFDACRIKAVKEQAFTSTPSTIDAALVFETIRDEAISERARIDSSGRLLVGTSSDVSGGIAGEISQVISSAGGGINLGRNDSTVTVDELIGVVNFYSYGGSSWQKSGSIKCEADAAQGDNDKPGRLVFSTTADGASSPTERLRITSAGVLQIADASNITVGTTSGTKIGTATTQKLGFFNATPVTQRTAIADATTAGEALTALNQLLQHMRDLGLIAT